MARRYMEGSVGEELLEVMRSDQRSFDRENLFNPGKTSGDGRSG